MEKRIPWNKGKTGIYSEESLRKMSESQRKRMSNPEQRKKFLESRKGIITGMSGKHHSEETRKKLSLKHLGKPGFWTGKSRYPETIRKMSEAQKKKMSNPEVRKKISEYSRKALSNPEVRKKMSETHKGQVAWNKGLKSVQISKRKGKTGVYSKETIKRMKEAQKKRFSKPEEKERMSKFFKKIWLNPQIRQSFKERRAKQIFPVKDSLPELKIQNFLRELSIEFIPHKYINKIKHSYQCDLFLPSINLIIEVDGNYWHNYPHLREIDLTRTKELIEKGFNVLRLWESDIKKMDINDFKNKISEIIC